jgi:hypothetical protein
MKYIFFTLVLFPAIICSENIITKNIDLKPEVSYSFISNNGNNLFIQQYTLNIFTNKNNKLNSNINLSYLKINDVNYIVPKIKLDYKINNNLKLFLDFQVIKPLNYDNKIEYKNFNNLETWK